MIGRSLDQHAQPITFGYRVSQWVEALGSAGQHFEQALNQLPIQWGGAVGTSTWWVDYFKADQPESDPMELRSEEHTSELQSRGHLVCRLLLEKKKKEVTYES